jgi:hypothetical protein
MFYLHGWQYFQAKIKNFTFGKNIGARCNLIGSMSKIAPLRKKIMIMPTPWPGLQAD